MAPAGRVLLRFERQGQCAPDRPGPGGLFFSSRRRGTCGGARALWPRLGGVRVAASACVRGLSGRLERPGLERLDCGREAGPESLERSRRRRRDQGSGVRPRLGRLDKRDRAPATCVRRRRAGGAPAAERGWGLRWALRTQGTLGRLGCQLAPGSDKNLLACLHHAEYKKHHAEHSDHAEYGHHAVSLLIQCSIQIHAAAAGHRRAEVLKSVQTRRLPPIIAGLLFAFLHLKRCFFQLFKNI
jgi:hypothetical protein